MDLLLNVLVASAQLVLHAAYCLRAEDISTEETDAGITQLLLRLGAPPPVGLFDQTVVVLGESDQLENGRVRKAWPQLKVAHPDARPSRIPVEDPSGDHSIERLTTLPSRVN